MLAQYVPILQNMLEESKKNAEVSTIVLCHLPFQKIMIETQKYMELSFDRVKVVMINHCDLRTL